LLLLLKKEVRTEVVLRYLFNAHGDMIEMHGWKRKEQLIEVSVVTHQHHFL
jgi:hypothetical protein